MWDALGQPASVTEALAMIDRGFDHLNAADHASLPSATQAETLRALERAQAKHTAARARVLAAFAGQAAHEDDGHGSARTWLRWQTRITPGAAAGAVGWARRLAAHPVIGDALAAGDLSESWARQLCAWTGRLPLDKRGDADEILASAARAGVDLPGLGGLAQEMVERARHDRDSDRDDGFDERYFRLGITFGGAGRAEGDLTPGCAAALDAVLESLGKKAGPEDTRTGAQRRHDALEEACRRLIASGMLPGRAGQPTQVFLHMTLAELRAAPGASAAEAAWYAARASQPGWLTGPATDAVACDATFAPVVTGHVDWAALDRLTEVYLATKGLGPGPASAPAAATGHATTAGPAGRGGPAGPDGADGTDGQASAGRPAASTDAYEGTGSGDADGPGAAKAARETASNGRTADATTCRCSCGGCTCPARTPLSPATLARLRETMLRLAADALSGPAGLAAWLRHAQLGDGPGGSTSRPLALPLPLDTGDADPVIPAALRRAVLTRHRHCTFPGCRTPATACDIHHYIPRSQGGRTALGNLGPVCQFHHLIAIHRWGWTLRLHADGTTTATSPDGTRTLHDHDPPRQAA